MKMLYCPTCKTTKKAARGQKYCSRPCALAARTPEAKRAYGVKAGKASARTKWLRMVAKWQAAYPGLDPALARQVYAVAYNAGWKVGQYNGYRKGWAAACGETWEAERRSA